MNNLRRDIHSAFEVIEPPLGGMPERVVQTVLAERNGRLRKEKMVYRLRISSALVAAVLVVAVAVAAVMTWNSIHNSNVSPTGQAHLTPLQELEARPLIVQTYQAPSECKSGPFTPDGDTGTGPIFAFGEMGPATKWGAYSDVYAFADKKISGPILIRAKDVFKNLAVVFIGDFAAGGSLGTDVVNGTTVTHHPEAVVEENQAAVTATAPYKASHKYAWHLQPGLPSSSSGSTGWQIDGAGFTETFYAC